MSPASLYTEHLYGADCITETVFGLEFSISPRAHFAINTYGAEILFETISQILGMVVCLGSVSDPDSIRSVDPYPDPGGQK
jgi:hypothetical protein